MQSADLCHVMRRMRRRAFEFVALRLPGGDPLVPRASLHAVGDTDFRATGDEFLKLFRELVDLHPDEKVLDVGCGTGRLARPLAGYLSEAGSYDGFDVSKLAIRWCQRHYARGYPNFTFRHVNVTNSSYNPDGGNAPEDFVFPYDDATFDFVFLTSVFTHMMPAAIERYMNEIARVLSPGGRCLVTFFLLNAESRQLISENRSTQRFSDTAQSYAVVDPAHPEDAVAFDENWTLAHMAHAGLNPRLPARYGSWCGRGPINSYQDIVIADRTASSAR
jgi:SAM-dependent methyltransferase